jgi:hypothetical protein
MPAPPRVQWIKQHPTATYVVLAYALSWSITIPLALVERGVLRADLAFKLHYLAQFGPMVAALIVTALVAGRSGLSDLGAHLARWRIGPLWWLIAVSPIALFVVAFCSARLVDGAWPRLREVGEVRFLPTPGLA